jgi:cyclopropane fatty-acyl-phospholipid synthase-like methyltransferase
VNVDARYFNALYASNEDPWRYQTRWYEERKRAIALASLPQEHYESTLEIGCSNGELTKLLAQRSSRLLACDISPLAVQYARNHLSTVSNATFECLRVPDEWPTGVFDLIVLSEIAYYLGPEDLCRMLRAMERAFSPRATLLACHWRHPIPESAISGDAIHQMLKGWTAKTEMSLLVEHVEKDFCLDVWCEDSRSVAAREGLI